MQLDYSLFGDVIRSTFFWADGIMQLDYSLFGDVISFDTTYPTNNQYQPLEISGQLDCKIDKVAGILETNHPDHKNALY
ncbi:hypothetical protein MTR_0337s0050 [Medicago truncatula]|uniref:Uncharacterized protein n=1 Tax=Medicago truncatula TaxID=3880 RepID=A0A072TGH5_MEDTR|nr:hypothetical protein MTR_0337s0050 [Medicago truncatula]